VLHTGFCWDTCASLNITYDLDDLVNVTPVNPPRYIGGIGSGVPLTQVGFLKLLHGYTTSVRRCFYSVDATHKLFAVGVFQCDGWSYRSVSTTTTEFYDPQGILFDRGILRDNNLLGSSLGAPIAMPACLSLPCPSPFSEYVCAASYADAVLHHVSAVPQWRRYTRVR
jgi:hypothetical protein